MDECHFNKAKWLCNLSEEPPQGMNFNEAVGVPETNTSNNDLTHTATLAPININTFIP